MNGTLAALMLVLLSALASAADHRTVRFVRASGVAQTLRDMTFSPDSSQLAVSTNTDRVSFIRTKDGEITGRFKLAPFSMAYSRDGSRLFMISEYGSELLSVATGRPIKFEPRQRPGFVGIDMERRNGKLLIASIHRGGPVAQLGTIRVGDELVGIGQSKTGRIRDLIGETTTTAKHLLRGPAGTHVRLQVIPQGQLRASVHTVSRQLRQLVGEKWAFVDGPGNVVGDNIVWCVQNGRHTFIDAFSGRTLATIETEDVESVGQYAISHDSSKFAVLAHLKNAKKGAAIEVFDVATQQRDAVIPFAPETWLAMAFSGDASTLLIGTWYTVEVLDWKTRRFLEPITLGQPPVQEVEKVGSPDGVAAGIAAFRSAARSQGPSSVPRQHVECLASSASGLLAVGNRGKVRLFSLADPQQLTTLDTLTERPIEQLRFSPDGSKLAYYCDGVLHIVDVGNIRPDSRIDVK